MVAQVAIAVVVLANATNVVASYVSPTTKPTGIDTDNIFWISAKSYAPDYNHDAEVKADLAWLKAINGVVSASYFDSVPQSAGTRFPLYFFPDTQGKGRAVPVYSFRTSDGAVETLGLKMVAGKSLTDASVVPAPATGGGTLFTAWAPEMVITRALAEALFPQSNAVGKSVFVFPINRVSTIIGVVDEMQAMPGVEHLGRTPNNVALVPALPPGPSALYLVRTRPGQLEEVISKVKSEFEAAQPSRIVKVVKTMSDTAAESRYFVASTASVVSMTTLLVVLVAAIAIYALTSFNVAVRTRQIATRRALGARKSDVARQFMVENALITGFGLLVGGPLALLVGVRLSVLFAIPRLPLDDLMLSAIAMLLIGSLATLVPLRNAMNIPPAVASRA